MPVLFGRRTCVHPRYLAIGFCALLATGCTPAIPPDLIADIDAVDHQLIELGAPRTAANEYASFATQWAALKIRAQAYDDLILWPWESNSIEDELRQLLAHGDDTLVRVQEEQAALRRTAEIAIAKLDKRLSALSSHVASLGGHIVLGKELTQTDLLLKQARSFFQQRDYARSLDITTRANETLDVQTAVLTRDLKRYADARQIARWQIMARQTVEWSRVHQSPAIIVSKVDRELLLYENGKIASSYPVRLGYNGLKDKLVQGDGATPEGRYRVVALKGEGETQFFRALLLDYPNQEDRRRFRAAVQAGAVSPTASIGGLIEIHGMDSTGASQTLGCIMLDNSHMQRVFSRVVAGTPVTIVGALAERNAITLALTELQQQRDAT
ncbi:L,D-transpeptidase family protein [Candidatus Nitrospira inopinata]|uniref:L,D-transpeptidase family protein n=1 Tax=Candidatus Nitrospira inopinata TaxID=1715989 RepID=UPI0007810B12|nr:L,D-transpeptidase [Candidatus Nitrospira inopinata]